MFLADSSLDLTITDIARELLMTVIVLAACGAAGTRAACAAAASRRWRSM